MKPCRSPKLWFKLGTITERVASYRSLTQDPIGRDESDACLAKLQKRKVDTPTKDAKKARKRPIKVYRSFEALFKAHDYRRRCGKFLYLLLKRTHRLGSAVTLARQRSYIFVQIPHVRHIEQAAEKTHSKKPLLLECFLGEKTNQNKVKHQTKLALDRFRFSVDSFVFCWPRSIDRSMLNRLVKRLISMLIYFKRSFFLCHAYTALGHNMWIIKKSHANLELGRNLDERFPSLVCSQRGQKTRKLSWSFEDGGVI